MTIKKAMRIVEESEYYISCFTNNHTKAAARKAEKMTIEYLEAIKLLLATVKNNK